MTNRFIIALFILLASCSDKSSKDKILIPNKSKALTTKKIKKDTIDNRIIKLKNPKRFEDYKVEVYSGKLAEPDFKNNEFRNDKEYVRMISESCKRNNVNFGGHYTIITQSCGAQCVHFFIINRKTGYISISSNPKDGKDGFEFRKNSELLIANSNLFVDEKFETYYKYFYTPEFYEWNGNDFIILK